MKHRRLRWIKVGVLISVSVVLILAAVVAERLSRLDAPIATRYVCDSHGQFICDVTLDENERLGFWPPEDVPKRVAAAFIAIEDRRFYWHPGVDILAVLRAINQNYKADRTISGASTLAMQVARMQHPAKRNLTNKFKEAISAGLMTLRHGRQKILAHYLTIVPFSNRIHGIRYAARKYFDKPAADLSWAEIAFLAAIPQAPTKMNPCNPVCCWRVRRRAYRILEKLKEREVFSEGIYEQSLSELSHLSVSALPERCTQAMHPTLRLANAIHRQLEFDSSSLPLMINSHLDLSLTRHIKSLMTTHLHTWKPYGALNAAAAVIELPDCHVRAWVGSPDYYDRDTAGAIDYSAVARLAGSTLKPFIYALALDMHIITSTTILLDTPMGTGGVVNADNRYIGPILPRTALANSRNVPAVRLLARIGLNGGYDFFRELGLHDGSKPADYYSYGMVIGGIPVTLENLLTAYTALATDGNMRPLRWSSQFPLIHQPRPLISTETARLITLFLSDPMARLPAFPRMGSSEYPFSVAVKTGTSSRYKDAWTVAYSTKYLVAAWVGRHDYAPMQKLSGSSTAAHLVRDILMHLHSTEIDGMNDHKFKPPMHYIPLKIDAKTGKHAGPLTQPAVLEWIAPEKMPSKQITKSFDSASDPIKMQIRNLLFDFNAGENTTQELEITSPASGTVIYRDPETPDYLSTILFIAKATGYSGQLIWYVNDQPLKVVERPYDMRWTIRQGKYSVYIKDPYSDLKSPTVTFTVH